MSADSKLIPLKNRKIVLIGGAGFIGHNLALWLKEQGAEVAIIDSLHVNNLLAFHSTDLSLPNRELYRGFIRWRLDRLSDAQIPLYIQDAQDYHAISHIISELQPHAIVHLAAVAHAGRSNKDPYSTFGHSLRTLENALDAARSFGVHFVYFSSSMVYGNFMTERVDEEHPLNPIGIYGALKVSGEKIVNAYNQVFDLPFTIIRPSALYGPGCVSRRVGQIFIERALEGEKLRVDGDGQEKLDFTYIDDLIHGVAQVLQHPAAKGEIFNLTYGASRSLCDLVEVIKKEIPDLEIEYVERDALMPFRGTLNIDKAKRLIDFNPQNPIDIGFPKYIQWYRDTFPEAVCSKAKV